MEKFNQETKYNLLGVEIGKTKSFIDIKDNKVHIENYCSFGFLNSVPQIYNINNDNILLFKWCKDNTPISRIIGLLSGSILELILLSLHKNILLFTLISILLAIFISNMCKSNVCKIVLKTGKKIKLFINKNNNSFYKYINKNYIVLNNKRKQIHSIEER